MTVPLPYENVHNDQPINYDGRRIDWVGQSHQPINAAYVKNRLETDPINSQAEHVKGGRRINSALQHSFNVPTDVNTHNEYEQIERNWHGTRDGNRHGPENRHDNYGEESRHNRKY